MNCNNQLKIVVVLFEVYFANKQPTGKIVQTQLNSNNIMILKRTTANEYVQYASEINQLLNDQNLYGSVTLLVR